MSRMTLIVPGSEVSLVMVVTLIIITLVASYLSKEGKIKPTIRRLPALDALEEGVGRATEMGRPVHFTTGGFSITSGGLGGFPAVMAGISCLGHVADYCARSGVRLIDSIGKADKYALEYETIKEAYIRNGVPENFIEDDVRYVSDTQHAFSSGILSTVYNEKCATNIMIGGFSGEAVLIAEGAHAAGCFQVGGNPRTAQVYFFVVVCDYALIGEEVYTAGAALRREPEELGMIFGQDIIRYIGMIILGLGALFALINNAGLYNIL